jgi:glycerol-3-phosphate acyltransferase PlsY
MDGLHIAVACYIAYLMGSLSCAIIVCHCMQLPDPRTSGSHNPGATNVLRVGGKKAALLTLLGDTLKSVIPLLIARWYGFDITALALIGLSAFLGHIFPIFFGFKGGKGVATAIGAIFVIAWPVGICWLCTWGMMAIVFRYSSLAALTASILTPLYFWYGYHENTATLILSIMAIILLLTHRDNIRRLLQGQENKLGQPKVA